MADAKDQESSEESELDSQRQTQKDPLPLKDFPIVQSDTVLAGSNSQEGLTGGLTGGSTGGKSSTENLKNDLPEDKEIQSSSDEEE